jgi:hypothetical protein
MSEDLYGNDVAELQISGPELCTICSKSLQECKCSKDDKLKYYHGLRLETFGIEKVLLEISIRMSHIAKRVEQLEEKEHTRTKAYLKSQTEQRYEPISLPEISSDAAEYYKIASELYGKRKRTDRE